MAAWTSLEEFTNEAASIPRVRRFVEAEMTEHGPARLVDVMCLVATELATNAFVHAHTPFGVRLTQDDSTLMVGVRDGSPVGAELADTSDSLRTNGRGIELVAHMAVDWGVTPGAMGGKTVWASFASGSAAA